MANAGQIAGEPEAPLSGPTQTRAAPSMTDASFVLIELGKLMSQSETTTRAIDKLADKLSKLEDRVSKLDDTVKGARAVGTVLIGVVTLLAGGMWWLGAALWPVRQKLIAAVFG